MPSMQPPAPVIRVGIVLSCIYNESTVVFNAIDCSLYLFYTNSAMFQNPPRRASIRPVFEFLFVLLPSNEFGSTAGVKSYLLFCNRL